MRDRVAINASWGGGGYSKGLKKAIERAGEADIVFVAAAARHRRGAFLAADYVMDRLKTEAAFWKREHGPDGDRWIEPTDNDRADLARWST